MSNFCREKEELGHKISQWSHYCELSDKLTNQVIDLRSDYDQVDIRVTEYLAWQDGEEGVVSQKWSIVISLRLLSFYLV